MTPARRIYFDHNATTPVRPEVLEAMLPYLKEDYGNPNSVHSLGQRARRGVEEARAQVAALIGADPSEIVFTSCGSEGNVAAISGAAWSGDRKHLACSAVEHESVRALMRALAQRGFSTTEIGVDGAGVVDPGEAAQALRADTRLLSVMHANNEVGAIQPIARIAEACRRNGTLLHVDAVQSAGKTPVDVGALGADLLSISGHKINAPKGIGALYVRSGLKLAPLITGHQERNRRGGTENVAGIVGLGKAAELARAGLAAHSAQLRRLRDRLEAGALKVPGAHRTSSAKERLPGTSHLCFEGVDGHHLVVALDLEGICVSSGPACDGGVTGLSHVLAAMKVPAELGRGSLRVSLGWGCSDEDVDRFLAVLAQAVEKLRAVGIR